MNSEVMKGRLLTCLLLAALVCVAGCNVLWPTVVLSRSPDGKKQILIRYGAFGDGTVYLVDSPVEKEIKLMGIGFADSNERIMKFSWSLDSSKIAFLISHSNDRDWIYGKRLVVFDLTGFPDGVKEVYDDHKSDIVDFMLSADEVITKLAGQEQWSHHRFHEE